MRDKSGAAKIAADTISPTTTNTLKRTKCAWQRRYATAGWLLVVDEKFTCSLSRSLQTALL
eukprot:5822873-Pleurochrysis_carterae.AAC.1